MTTKAKVKENGILSAEDMLAKMRAGTKEIHEVKMREFTVQLRVLSIDEMNDIRRDAYKTALAIQGDNVDKDLLIEKTTLKLASTSHASGGVPLLSDKLLGLLSTDEINYLYNEYIRILDSVNPALESIGHEEFRELVDSLKKNLISGNDLSIRQLKVICSSYVDLISQKDS
jgi:hypothetical protein